MDPTTDPDTDSDTGAGQISKVQLQSDICAILEAIPDVAELLNGTCADSMDEYLSDCDDYNYIEGWKCSEAFKAMPESEVLGFLYSSVMPVECDLICDGF
jgi:hypothetical protein